MPEDMKSPAGPKKLLQRGWFWASVAGLMLLVWLGVGFFLPPVVMPEGGEAGALGDQFGAVNSLFAGLAFVGLLWTITQQREEIRLARDANAMMREELNGLLAEQRETQQIRVALDALKSIRAKRSEWRVELDEARQFKANTSGGGVDHAREMVNDAYKTVVDLGEVESSILSQLCSEIDPCLQSAVRRGLEVEPPARR